MLLFSLSFFSAFNFYVLILRLLVGLVTKLCVTLLTSWTVACQAPLFMGFSRQEYWIELPFPSPGDLPDPGIQSGSIYIYLSIYIDIYIYIYIYIDIFI